MFRFLRAVLLLSGMVIGAGMFAIPFSFAAAGFWLGVAELAILSLVVLTLHLLYAEIVLATPHLHRMPGYVRIYLGRVVGVVSWASSVFGSAGTLLAYLVIGTLFLQTIAGDAAGSYPLLWAVGLACIVAVITRFSLKKSASINGILTIFEIASIAGLSFFLLFKMSLAHLSGIRVSNAFLPYGVLLFALSGASVIPDLVTILGRNKTRVRAAIVAGSLIPALLYFLFAYAVVGVAGLATSEEAIAGLQRAVGGNIALWASAAGFLAVFTSFVVLSSSFQAMLFLDLGMPRSSAWLVASAIPFVLYLAGFQNFIAVISVVGIISFGIDGALFLLMGRTIREKECIRNPLAALMGYVILAVIVIGVIAEFLRIFA